MLNSDTGIILVDHGSVRREANEMLEAIATLYQQNTGIDIVEPAHMELAEPSLENALDRCVAAGAKTVVVMPYFLFPGRHSAKDIPRIAQEAAAKHPGVRVLISEALGLDSRLTDLAHDRVVERLALDECHNHDKAQQT